MVAAPHPGFAPDLQKYLKSLKGQSLEASIESLIALLKRRQIKGSEPCAVATCHILLQVVARSKWADVDQLLSNIVQVGGRLISAQPHELVVANVVRRVLGLIRDEATENRRDDNDAASVADTQNEEVAPEAGASAEPADAPTPSQNISTYAKQDSAGDYLADGVRQSRPPAMASFSTVNVPKSLFHILAASPPADRSFDASPFPSQSGASTPSLANTLQQPQRARIHELRSEIIDGIEEIQDEIASADDQIAGLGEVHILPSECLLLYRPSPTVERFVLAAAKKRKFSVFLVSDPPSRKPADTSHVDNFRTKLQAAGISTTVLSNSGLAAYMPRIHKVILPARAVVASGCVVGETGARAVARAAREHGRPVYVLAGVYKLSPRSVDSSNLVEWGDPSEYVPFSDGGIVGHVSVKNPVTETVPSSLVTVYVTNLGAHTGVELSRVVADHYKVEDVDFDF